MIAQLGGQVSDLPTHVVSRFGGRSETCPTKTKLILLFGLAPLLSAQVAVNVTLQTGSPGLPVPLDFTGFSYEISSVSGGATFYPANYTLQRMIAQAGPGILRFGGNS